MNYKTFIKNSLKSNDIKSLKKYDKLTQKLVKKDKKFSKYLLSNNKKIFLQYGSGGLLNHDHSQDPIIMPIKALHPLHPLDLNFYTFEKFKSEKFKSEKLSSNDEYNFNNLIDLSKLPNKHKELFKCVDFKENILPKFTVLNELLNKQKNIDFTKNVELKTQINKIFGIDKDRKALKKYSLVEFDKKNSLTITNIIEIVGISGVCIYPEGRKKLSININCPNNCIQIKDIKPGSLKFVNRNGHLILGGLSNTKTISDNELQFKIVLFNKKNEYIAIPWQLVSLNPNIKCPIFAKMAKNSIGNDEDIFNSMKKTWIESITNGNTGVLDLTYF